MSSRLALRMAGALALVVVPACALACAPPPHRASSPTCAALRPPPAKSGQGASARPPSTLPRRRLPLAGSRKNRAGQRLGRGWGGGPSRSAASAASVAGGERAASANMRHGSEEARYAGLNADAGGHA
ncbi:hypothetical protein B0H14DRAFT_490191 [Mycena olivaceomarginata]|nr:hypothetical protein B0H14DRAFT_490191 [Mycena olivaceomarginata]